MKHCLAIAFGKKEKANEPPAILFDGKEVVDLHEVGSLKNGIRIAMHYVDELLSGATDET